MVIFLLVQVKMLLEMLRNIILNKNAAPPITRVNLTIGSTVHLISFSPPKTNKLG